MCVTHPVGSTAPLNLPRRFCPLADWVLMSGEQVLFLSPYSSGWEDRALSDLRSLVCTNIDIICDVIHSSTTCLGRKHITFGFSTIKKKLNCRSLSDKLNEKMEHFQVFFRSIVFVFGVCLFFGAHFVHFRAKLCRGLIVYLVVFCREASVLVSTLDARCVYACVVFSVLACVG